MRRRRLVVILGVALVLAAWGTARVVDSWRYRASLEQAKARIDSGSPAEARRLLAESAARWPREGEVTFLLGACEQALGRPDAAEAAWSRVPTDSPFAGHAAMLRVRLLLKRDRFAAAEELLPAALRASGQHAIEVRETLVAPVQARGAVRRGAVPGRRRAGTATPTGSACSDNWQISTRSTRYRSRRSGPLWRRRPRTLRMTTGSGLVERTSPSVPASSPKPSAGSTTACGDARATPRSGRAGWTWPLRRATWPGRGRPSGISRPTASRLRRSSPYAPGSPRDLATKSGSGRRWRSCSSVRLAGSRPWSGWPSSNCSPGGPRAPPGCARKAELDRAKIHYEILVTKPSAEAVRHSVEMARLAEVLGRSFEARSLWSVALERSPGDREAREARTRLERAGAARAGLTLAGLLAELGPAPAQGTRSLGRLSAPPAFTDDAEASGLRFRFDNGATPARQIPETMSGGVGLLDYDGDGWLDVYLVQGGPVSPRPDQADRTLAIACSATGGRHFRGCHRRLRHRQSRAGLRPRSGRRGL